MTGLTGGLSLKSSNKNIYLYVLVLWGVLNLEGSFLTIMNSPSSRIVRKRSVFKGSMAYVSSRQEAESFFNLVKLNNKGAAHNVLSYLIFESNLAYCCDDGEPSKTAGEPVLNVLKNSGVFNVCVVITRYFGGVLLGTGGLVEAYSSACKAIFENVKYAKCCLCATVRVFVDYGSYAKLQFLLKFFKVNVLNVDFAVKVTVNFSIEFCKLEEFEVAVRQRLGFDFSCEVLEKKWSRIEISQNEVEKFKLIGKKINKQ